MLKYRLCSHFREMVSRTCSNLQQENKLSVVTLRALLIPKEKHRKSTHENLYEYYF